MKERIAFVCQRYGMEVNGGSELYCRQLAEKLLQLYDVEVFTTCAEDYVTWANQYPVGDTTINGVLVHRYPVTKERNQKTFDAITRKVLGNSTHTDEEELKWIEEQGPVCPQLLEVLKKEYKQYKAVIFMTYLYYLTAKGLPIGFENAILIPTVHDELPVYLREYDKIFAAAKGIIWNTDAEQEFALRRFPHIRSIPSIMAGIGVDVPEGELPNIPESIQGKDYIVYAGRIDESKGCGDMFRCFEQYKKKHPQSNLKLVLIGKPVMKIPKHRDIINLGFVSNEMKFAVMRAAKALVLFSQYESLSMVVLESMTMGRPVLVNGKCEVLKGHCIKGEAGLYFTSAREFDETLDYLLEHDDVYNAMCNNGKIYVRENYQWDVILERISHLIDGI